VKIAYRCACGAAWRGSVKPDSAAALVQKAILDAHSGPGHALFRPVDGKRVRPPRPDRESSRDSRKDASP
jgi:hypothetical protein